MKKKLLTVFVLIISVINAQNTYEVASDGRRIQLDGFLLEWKTDAAKPFGKIGEWGCDAIKTVEGLSGYCKSRQQLSCADWTVVFTDRNSRIEIVKMRFTHDSDAVTNACYQYDRELFVSSGKLVSEWVIPWDRLSVNNSNNYTMDIQVVSSCGDTLPLLAITGNKNLGKTKSVWSGTATRAVAIAVLTILFVIMRRKLRKRKSQKV